MPEKEEKSTDRTDWNKVPMIPIELCPYWFVVLVKRLFEEGGKCRKSES